MPVVAEKHRNNAGAELKKKRPYSTYTRETHDKGCFLGFPTYAVVPVPRLKSGKYKTTGGDCVASLSVLSSNLQPCGSSIEVNSPSGHFTGAVHAFIIFM